MCLFERLKALSFTQSLIKGLNLCKDGVRADRAERFAEEREGRLEQVDSGTESADDRYVSPPTLNKNIKTFHSVIPKQLLSFSHRPDRKNDSRHSRRDSSDAD